MYSQRARRDHQPRLTELVPTRYRTLAVWLAVGLAAVGAVVAIDTWLPQLVRWLHAEGNPALELTGHRPLAVWMSSLLLGSGGLVALLLYSLRRHRVDDYHGRYRVWLWGAALWFCLSLDEATSLHTLAQILCTSWSVRWSELGSRLELVVRSDAGGTHGSPDRGNASFATGSDGADAGGRVVAVGGERADVGGLARVQVLRYSSPPAV